jgi:DNA-binding GntR family transcriptional regulator
MRSSDVLRVVEGAQEIDTAELGRRLGVGAEDLREVLGQLRRQGRITIDSDAELTRVLVRLAPPQATLFLVA